MTATLIINWQACSQLQFWGAR